MQKPGLALSRSIGDSIGAQVGLIAEPGTVWIPIFSNRSLEDVENIVLKDEDKCIVMGSDGLFNCLTNNEVQEASIWLLINFIGHSNCGTVLWQKRPG